MEIIGLTGYAQSGKDTVGQYLVKHYGYTRISFADAVREALYALNPIAHVFPSDNIEHANGDIEPSVYGYISIQTLVSLVGWETAKKAKNVRELLQRMGTEAGRDIHGKDCWTRIGLEKALQHRKVVFTDVRFENEVEAVKSIGGQIVRITRPGVGAVNGHISDKRLDDSLVDFEIENNSTLEDLYEKLDEHLTSEMERANSVWK